MPHRWHILLLILVTLTAFCGLAAAKLRATPKYDRIQVGMTGDQVAAVIGEPPAIEGSVMYGSSWDGDEGRIVIDWGGNYREFRVRAKSIERRGPLERLAWLAGWR